MFVKSKRLSVFIQIHNRTKRGKKRKADPTPSSGANQQVAAVMSSDIAVESSSQPIADVTERKIVKGTEPSEDENFETYKKIFSKWTVKLSKSHTMYESSCDCSTYLKEYLCKHIVGLGMRFKLITVPPEAKTVPIGEKRKRGRPSKTKPAWMVQ